METIATKPLSSVRDLALAYSPGVAAPSLDIARDPESARVFTNKASLVAVISNGSAVLGLGDIGPLAAKPVMEGKAALFRRFAGLNAVDLCINEKDPAKLAAIVASLEPSFGGVNLEDIKAPDCFEVEARCRASMSIPVFHDDQHGTAVVVLAGVENALRIARKRIEEIKIAVAGAGAAGLACLDLLIAAGAKRENIIVADRAGVVYRGRKEEMDPRKAEFAAQTRKRTLAEAIVGADLFLGVSAAGVLSPEMVRSMAPRPIIFALANPEPEIWPEDARDVAPDAIIATGRSDYSNQVNNVLCFPFLFRGALDVGAATITETMKLAASRALSTLAQSAPPESVRNAYGWDGVYTFGPDYILPKPFDPRLLPEIATAVARAALDAGVARAPIADLEAYRAVSRKWPQRSSPKLTSIRFDIRQIRAIPPRFTTEGAKTAVAIAIGMGPVAGPRRIMRHHVKAH